MKKRILAFMLAVCTASGLCGCGGGNDGKTLVYGSADYTAVNPALYEHGEINSLLFIGLTAHNEDNETVPAAASSWTYDEATCTYDFTMREGLTFHDGEPLTARDAAFTIEAVMDPDNGSELASDFESVEAVEAVDELHLRLRLSEPNTAVLDYLTVGILPRHLLEGKDLVTDDFNRNPVGAGPYRLVKWDRGQSITLEAFEDFYMGAPKIERIIFKIVPDSDARALQLLSGELDLAQIAPKHIESVEALDGYKVYVMDTADYRGIMYNFNSDFFSRHRELPAALSYAIDREAIVESVLLGYGTAAYSPLQKGAYRNEDIEKYEYDPQKAMKLLEAADWVRRDDGCYYKDGEQLAFEICSSRGDSVRVAMAEICAQNLRDIGANVVVKVGAETDWEHLDAYLIGWGSPFDPDTHTYKVFGTDMAANYGSYSNSAVDSLLREARGLQTEEERLPLYMEFQRELAQDPPYTFIAYIDAVYACSERISGINEKQVLGHHGVGIFNNVYEWDINE